MLLGLVVLVVPLALALISSTSGCNALLDIPEVEHRDADGGAPATSPTACSAGQKACGAACVSVLEPATGCGAMDCTPCALAHAKLACVQGQCAIEACEQGFDNCNGVRSDGCEADLRGDAKNCKTCGNDCGAFQCTNGACVCSKNDDCGFNGVCDQGSCTCGPNACSPGSACSDVDTCQF